MTWEYVSVGTAAEGADNSSLSVPFPGSIVAGGAIFCFLANRTVLTTRPAPSGWSVLKSYDHVILFGKIASGTESGNETFTFTGGAGDKVLAQMAFFKGAPADISASVHGTGNTYQSGAVDIATPSATVTQNNTLILYCGAKRALLDGTFSSMPNSSTIIADTQRTTGNSWTHVWSYTIQTTAASIGTSKFDTSSSDTADDEGIVASILTGTGGSAILKLKLLAHSSAASQSSIEGVVLNAARDTVIGEFTAQTFDTDLVGTEAQLLITATDISPNGSTLTTSDHPLAIAYNATYTTGLVTCDVVEV